MEIHISDDMFYVHALEPASTMHSCRGRPNNGCHLRMWRDEMYRCNDGVVFFVTMKSQTQMYYMYSGVWSRNWRLFHKGFHGDVIL